MRAVVFGAAIAATMVAPVAAQRRATPKAPVAEPAGGWTFKTETDPVSDKATFTAQLVSGEDGVLQAFCSPGDVESLKVIVTGKNVQYRALQHVDTLTYRFDANPPVTGDWLYVRRSAALVTSQQAAAFLKPLATATKLIIRTYDLNGGPSDITFDVRGGTQAMARLVNECKF